MRAPRDCSHAWTLLTESSAAQAFQRTTAASSTDQEIGPWKDGTRVEALLIASLGTGLDGHPGLAHGGTIGTLFDESLSLGALQVLPRAFMTANTVIRYKKALPTPGVVLVRSEVTKWEGRKAWVKGTMEDGNGEFCIPLALDLRMPPVLSRYADSSRRRVC